MTCITSYRFFSILFRVHPTLHSQSTPCYNAKTLKLVKRCNGMAPTNYLPTPSSSYDLITRQKLSIEIYLSHFIHVVNF